MPVVRKTWADRVVENPTQKKVTVLETPDENILPADLELTLDIQRDEGKVSKEGSPLNAASLNDLENRFGDAVDSAEAKAEKAQATADKKVSRAGDSGITGDLIPEFTNQVDLGSENRSFRNIFGALKGHADSATSAESAASAQFASIANRLATPRNFLVNLASAVGAGFDGSSNASPGVTGILPVANGGTGSNSDDKYVKIAGDQTIVGKKTFSNPVAVSTPTANDHAATKKYVDDAVGSGSGGSGGVKKYATLVVGHVSSGHTLASCDYLCAGADDQIQINAALAALPDIGGKVVVLEGEYSLSGGVSISKDNTTLQGIGNSTKFLMSGSGSAINCPRSNCYISKLYVYKQENSNHGISLGVGSRNTVSNNTFYGGDGGIYSSGYNNKILNNACIGCRSGIDVKGPSCTVVGNEVSGNTLAGIIIESKNATQNTVSANTCNGNLYGIYLYNGANSNTVSGNACNGNKTGIVIFYNDPKNNTVVGNNAFKNTEAAVQDSGTDNLVGLNGGAA